MNSQRGADGGYWLAKPAGEISVADVIRAIDGPLAWVRGVRPEDLDYAGPARALQDVWIAARASLREVLEVVTLADVAGGTLPASVRALSGEPSAWEVRRRAVLSRVGGGEDVDVDGGVRLGPRWRPFAVLAVYLEIARLTTRGLVRRRRAGIRWSRTWRPMTPTRSMTVSAMTPAAAMSWSRAA